MLKFLKWLLIAILALALVIVVWLVYMGVFTKLTVTEREIGPYTLVYEEYVGPYSDTGRVIQRVYDGCTQEGVMTTKGFGIYLTSPKETAWDKSRSEIGCVLEPQDLGKARMLARKFRLKVWPKTKCLVTEFPIKNNFSYMIGPMKAYPELNKAMETRKLKLGTCMELYDLPAKKTLFIFKVVR
ncbi:MAG: hypothetical protein MUC35_04575 [Candidatus Margulisbacteria bacterium]|nr:hypothetical protein [Candidatus Margulisiibacteriota bacterium]